MQIKNLLKSWLAKTNYAVINRARLTALETQSRQLSSGVLPRHRYQWAHHADEIPSRIDYGFIPHIEPSLADYEICERLLRYFRACSNSPEILQKEKKDVWRDLEDNMHQDFLDCLHNNDSKRLAAYLCNMASNNATHGLSQGAQTTTVLQQNLAARERVASLYFDRIVCLAEMMGCLPVEQPEQGRFGENIKCLVDEVVQLIESEMGFPILPPQIEGGLFGLKLRDGILAQRDIFALEAALRLKSITEFTGLSAVGEIGAGIGKAAFWSWKMGVRDYSIFDLPYVSVISAFYLIKALPLKSVVLYGEREIESKNAIKIYPHWCFKDTARKRIEIILNQDSFPEMDDAIVLDYLQTMKWTGVKYFLSLNQEGMERSMSFERKQGRVCVWTDRVQGFQRIHRTKAWTRPGYVEELFQVAGEH